MKMILKAGLVALLVVGAFALPVQEAEAATRCYWRNGHRVCHHVSNSYRYRTVCSRHHGVRTCRRVAY